MHDVNKDDDVYGYGRNLAQRPPIKPTAPPLPLPTSSSEYEDVTIPDNAYDRLVGPNSPVKESVSSMNMYNRLSKSGLPQENRQEKCKSVVYKDTDCSFRINATVRN